MVVLTGWHWCCTERDNCKCGLKQQLYKDKGDKGSSWGAYIGPFHSFIVHSFFYIIFLLLFPIFIHAFIHLFILSFFLSLSAPFHSHPRVTWWRDELGTHFLSGDQQQAVLLPMMHLSEDVVEHQQLRPAVMEKLHLVSHLQTRADAEVTSIRALNPSDSLPASQQATLYIYIHLHLHWGHLADAFIQSDLKTLYNTPPLPISPKHTAHILLHISKCKSYQKLRLKRIQSPKNKRNPIVLTEQRTGSVNVAGCIFFTTQV